MVWQPSRFNKCRNRLYLNYIAMTQIRPFSLKPSPFSWLVITFLAFLPFLLVAGCTANTPEQPYTIPVRIEIDQQIINQDIPAGSTVQRAIEMAGVSLGNLDKVEPPGFTSITESTTIKITRVREEFELEENIIPFSQQKVRNESLAEGQTLLIQPGVNGTEQITYRLVFENNLQISRTAVKTSILVEPKPEIIMIGIKAPFAPVEISGKLVYIIAGNAWLMQNTTSERIPLITSGDLDGRIFRLSADGKWLLFTRSSTRDPAEEINSLWIANISVTPIRIYDLQARNVITFADWLPGFSQAVIFSTVEPRSTAPGWQSNNDLNLVKFTTSGNLTPVEEILPPNSGGVYGWWGTQFEFSPDRRTLLYARSDSIGTVDLETGDLQPLFEIVPYQTRSDWAWVPGISWSPDSDLIFTVSHPKENGPADPESSEFFSLVAFQPDSGILVDLVNEAGMFAYPSASPSDASGRFSIAFLKAIFPRQSADSRYRLWLMEQDGSNQQPVFPPMDSPGLDPQKIVWSPPDEMDRSLIAVIYQGNLYLINPADGKSTQITGDGLLTQLDWR